MCFLRCRNQYSGYVRFSQQTPIFSLNINWLISVIEIRYVLAEVGICFIKTFESHSRVAYLRVWPVPGGEQKPGIPRLARRWLLCLRRCQEQTAVTRIERFLSYSDRHADWPVLGTTPLSLSHGPEGMLVHHLSLSIESHYMIWRKKRRLQFILRRVRGGGW
jgi:hypothetical protein